MPNILFLPSISLQLGCSFSSSLSLSHSDWKANNYTRSVEGLNKQSKKTVSTIVCDLSECAKIDLGRCKRKTNRKKRLHSWDFSLIFSISYSSSHSISLYLLGMIFWLCSKYPNIVLNHQKIH